MHRSPRFLHALRHTGHLAMVAILASACSGGAVDPSQQARGPRERGPWKVGVTTLTVVDPDDDARTFPLEVWYPATPEPGATVDVVFNIPNTSVRDAPADLRGAPFPVVVFSHGNTGIRTQSLYLTEHLASHGYLVAAPDHLRNTFLDNDESARGEVMAERPRDMQLALDELLRRAEASDGLLSGLADTSRIGAAGHSFGGYTTLLLAGVTIDVAAYEAACAPTPDRHWCEGAGGIMTQEQADGFADPRIKAAVAMAPGGLVVFGEAGLGHNHAALQVQGGTLDTMTPVETEAEPIYEGLAAPKQLAVLEDAAHFSFSDICPLYELAGGAAGVLQYLATEGCGPNTIPSEEAQDLSRTLATAFFELHLRGIPDDAGYLDPTRGLPGVTLR